MKGQQQLPGSLYVLGTLADEFVGWRDALCLEGVFVSFQLIDPAVGIAGVYIQDAPVSGGEQLAGSAVHRRVIVADSAVYILAFQEAVDQHDGKVGSSLDDIGIILGTHLHELGTGQYDGIHPFGTKQIKILLFGVQVIAGAAENGVIAVGAQSTLQIVDGACQIRIGRIGSHDSDGFHGI